MGSVSLLMAASRDEATVRALLTQARPFVDEVVLGVDTRAADRILSTCGDLVDQAYTYEFETTVEQYTAWLAHRCTSDWILRLDDDEVLSPTLLEMLPELTDSRRHSLLLLPIRHLFPDRGQFITSHPWHPEYQGRLLRNVPGLWTFGGTSHSSILALGERRRIPEAPIYHLHFAVPDTDARLATARLREAATPGLATESFSVNAVSLPELWTNLQTAPVPTADREQIERIANPPTVTPGDPVPAPLIPADDAMRLVCSREVPPDAYRASIEISPARTHLAAGTVAQIEIWVHNLGTEHWPPAHHDAPLIRPAYRWLSADGDRVIDPEGLRTPFEERVFPGERAVVMLAVEVPATPGEYILEVDIVHELVRWFDCCARATMVVEELDPATIPATSKLARPDMASLGFGWQPPDPPSRARAPRRSREPSGQRARFLRRK